MTMSEEPESSLVCHNVFELLTKSSVIDDLDRGFAAILSENHHARSVCFYTLHQVRRENGIAYFGINRLDKDSHLVEFEPETEFWTAITTGKSFFTDKPDENCTRFIYPVGTGGRVRSVIAADFTRHPGGEMIQRILALYANQENLIRARDNDFLTGMLNRQAFNRIMDAITSKLPGHSKGILSHNHLVFLDIDHFKRINDDFGHMIGDEILIMVSQVFTSVLRFNDLVFRYGGEEFCVLLHDATDASALEIIERLRSRIQETRFTRVGTVTISAGIAPIDASDPYSSIDDADRALYYSKETGRNRTSCYPKLVESGTLEGRKNRERTVLLWDAPDSEPGQ